MGLRFCAGSWVNRRFARWSSAADSEQELILGLSGSGELLMLIIRAEGEVPPASSMDENERARARRSPAEDPLPRTRSFSLRMQRGRVRQADDRTLARLKPSDRLSPGLGTCLVHQRVALFFQLVRSDLDGVSVRDLELDARLRHRSIGWPVRGAEAGLCSLR
jgi:hypothetical protein